MSENENESGEGLDLFNVFATLEREQLEIILIRLLAKYPEGIDYVVAVSSYI